MFYGECYKCGERWELGTETTCKCEAEIKFDASAPVLITSHPYFYKRPWVGLTDEDIAELRRSGLHAISDTNFRAIEAKLKEKNSNV